MPKDEAQDQEQSQSLLANTDQELEHTQQHDGDALGDAAAATQPPRRQSAFSKIANGETRSPRTPNRVRFDIEDESEGEELGRHSNGTILRSTGTLQEQELDGRDSTENGSGRGERSSTGQRAPLLTGIEAPSVTVAADWDFNAEDYLDTARPKSGIRSAFLNMANSIIGAGIIGQAYAFKQAGLVAGIVLLVGLTVTVDWTIRLIVINSKLSGSSSFQGTMQHVFGKTGLMAISVAQWAFAFGGMIAFCIIVGDTIPHVMIAIFPSLPDKPFLWLFSNRRAIIILLILGVSYPLSLYRDISKLAKASGLALVSMLIIIITIVTQGPRMPHDLRGNLKGSLFVKAGISQAIGVISFAFVCHHNSLLIYGSLKKPTLDRFTQVTHYSTFVSMVACLIVALAGFLTFGDRTLGNVLNNFPTDNTMVNIARLCFGLNMLSTLPLECFVCREVMLNYWFPNEPFNMNLHLIFTTALVVTATGLSLITCDLGTVFELVGATSACVLAYILPPLCYIKLSKRSWKTIPALACIVFGFVVMFISLFQAIAKMIRNEGAVQTCG